MYDEYNKNGSQNSEKKKFTVHISDEDYGDYGYDESPRPRRTQQRSNNQSLAKRQNQEQGLRRREIPVSRTRVVTNRMGDKYEIPEESMLSPKALRSQKKNQKGRGCIIAVVYAAIVCAISALLSFYLIVGINDMFGLVKEEAEIEVYIPVDADLDEVSKRLGDAGVVDYPFFFKLYASFTNDEEFRGGATFTLNSKSDYDMLIRKLTRPASADGSIVTVTFPEGFNVEQIAERLEEYYVCDADAFIASVNNYREKFKQPFLNYINVKQSTERIYGLEGYLFPDTYSFYMQEGSVSAINKMLNAFSTKVINNPDLLILERANALGVTIDDIITIASIIERETPNPDEMKNVASVFYNRLRNRSHDGIGGKLQSDATRWYPYTTGNDMRESQTLTAEQKQNWQGTYDTTTFAGLPPGPICCPSYKAIYAACYPNNTNYYYFFTDDNQAHYYATTYGEFQAKLDQARAAGVFSG